MFNSYDIADFDDLKEAAAKLRGYLERQRDISPRHDPTHADFQRYVLHANPSLVTLTKRLFPNSNRVLIAG